MKLEAMNQVGASVMAEASGNPTRPTMFVAGDDAGHKPLVLGLVSELGFDALAAGPLRIARLLEAHAMLSIPMVVNRTASMVSAFAFRDREQDAKGAKR